MRTFFFFKVVEKKVTIIHWNDIKLRYYNHYHNFEIPFNGENTTFVGLSPNLPVVCKAFWVPLRLEGYKALALGPTPRPNRYWDSLHPHLNVQSEG